MPSVGQRHFDDYPPATQAKHAILTKYFRAYVKALERQVDAFHYIDGFAGQGTYGDDQPGSALLATTALSELSKPASVTLVEADGRAYEKLKQTVSPYVAGLDDSWIAHAEFESVADEVLARPIYRRYGRVATFAFIDPCGVRGVRLSDISRLMSLRYGECLLFLNYDGLSRWLGAVAAGSHPADRLVEFFGSRQILGAALDCCSSNLAPRRKEIELRDLYLEALRDSAGARFLLPFRFEAAGKARTSHYLIHCSRHSLAFRMMKEVMSVTATEGTDAGVFEFLRADESGAQASLFRPAEDQARAAILAELHRGDRKVQTFTEQWVLRPDDFLVGKQYRRILLQMEVDGFIEVLDPKTGRPKPAGQRMKGGRATLSPSLIVRGRI